MHQAALLLQKGTVACAHVHGCPSLQQRSSSSRGRLSITSHKTHNKQQVLTNAQRQQSAMASDAWPASQHKASISSSDPASWPQRMASIQSLMNKVREQLQQHGKLQSKEPALAEELKRKCKQHLDLLMQLAEAEQRHITGDMETEELQRLLQDMQQWLDRDQQEVLAALQVQPDSDSGAASDARTSSGNFSGHKLYVDKHKEQVGTTAEVNEVIDRASRSLSSTQQELQEPSGTTETATTAEAANETSAEHHKVLLETEERVGAAEASVHSLQHVLQDYDLVCQRAFELSRKLSLAEAENAELKNKLAHVKMELAGAADELAEHRELQMQYDIQCQDMYRLRMMLQQTQAAGDDVAAQAAGTASKYKKDIAWLMEAHRRELSEQYTKNQQLTESMQELRMRLLELEQQLWSRNTDCSSSSNSTQSDRPNQQVPQAAVEQQQQHHQLPVLEATVQQLTQEKQQLMKSLQDLQRQQAVLLIELQSSQQQLVTDSQMSGATEEQAAELASQAVLSLQQQLAESAEQRDALIQQVQELQQGLQEARAAAAAAASQHPTAAMVEVDDAKADPSALAAAEQELADVKAQVVQLRGQLAETRRELQAVTGRVAAAEAALQQQAVQYEARLQQLQVLYSKQTAVVARLRQGKAPPPDSVGFKNTNRFWVPQQLMFEFLKHWVVREEQLHQQPGFLGLQVDCVPGVSSDGGVDVVVSSMWESIPLWETWSKSETGRQQHMPVGVYQYVPRKGEGFPEDFVPFRDYDEAVNAKYSLH